MYREQDSSASRRTFLFGIRRGEAYGIVFCANEFVEVEGDSTVPAGLFVSLLLRYPDMGTVKYRPDNRCIVMSFMLYPSPEAHVFDAFSKRLRQSLEVYSDLSGRAIHILNVTRVEHAECTVIEATRDVDTLTQEELALIVALIRETFGDRLISERVDPVSEEDLQVHDEIIGHMLDDVRQVSSLDNLVGFREGGRVLLFNRGERNS